MLTESLHVHGSSGALSDFESSLWLILRVTKQILHFLIIDFKHTELNLKLQIFVVVQLDSLEDLVASNRHYTLVAAIADHGV